MSTEDEYLDDPIKVTLKAGPGFEAPWMTVSAGNGVELVARLAELHAADAFQKTREYALEFMAKKPAKTSEAAPSAPTTTPPVSDSPKQASDLDATRSASRTPQETTPPPASGAASDPIAEAIAKADSPAKLGALYKQHKAEWNDKYNALAKARTEELKK
jgi:hypothetical protein